MNYGSISVKTEIQEAFISGVGSAVTVIILYLTFRESNKHFYSAVPSSPTISVLLSFPTLVNACDFLAAFLSTYSAFFWPF